MYSQDIMARCDALAACSEQPDGLTRRYLTAEHRRANELVAGWMERAGMSARVDAAGNVIGRYEGYRPGAPALLLGSHLDTVRNAGRYDGMLGVVLPITCVEQLHRQGRRYEHAIEVIGFGDEEGVRFQSTLIGSRAVAGTLERDLLQRRDADGVTLARALGEFGLDPARIGEAARRREDVLGYVEVHIEQGPVLEYENLPVGLVTSIAGATRLSVTVDGMAGHAGTVPMRLRRDALGAAAEMVLAVESRCRAGDHGRSGLVGTVGQLQVQPGAVNVIPGRVTFSIDVRADADADRLQAVAAVREALAAIAARRDVTVSIDQTHASDSTRCAGRLMRQLGNAIEALHLRPRALPSGAGHDAIAMAGLTDVAMLFVRCRGGVSHHPDEAMSAADADVAAGVLLYFLHHFDAGPDAGPDAGR